MPLRPELADYYAIAATPQVRRALDRGTALTLPDLTRAQREQCLVEAVEAVYKSVGRVPVTDEQEALWDARVDVQYLARCLFAREQLGSASPRPWYNA